MHLRDRREIQLFGLVEKVPTDTGLQTRQSDSKGKLCSTAQGCQLTIKSCRNVRPTCVCRGLTNATADMIANRPDSIPIEMSSTICTLKDRFCSKRRRNFAGDGPNVRWVALLTSKNFQPRGVICLDGEASSTASP